MLSAIMCFVFALGCSNPPEPKPKNEDKKVQPKEEVGPKATNSNPPRTIEVDESRWQSKVDTGPDSFIVTDTINVNDTLPNAEIELREKASQRAIELTVKELLRTQPEAYSDNLNEIKRVFLTQFQKYLVNYKVVEKQTLGGGARLGLKASVTVARAKIRKGLIEEGILKIRQIPIVIVLNKPHPKAAKVPETNEAFLQDVAQNISGELRERTLEPKTWDAARRELNELLDEGNKELESLLEKFVVGSEWQQSQDDRYDLPLLYMRTQGRFLVGFKFLEFAKRELTFQATLRVEILDMTKNQALKPLTKTSRLTLGDKSLVEARTALVNMMMKETAIEVADRIQKDVAREDRLLGKEYKLVFQGYKEEQLARLEELLAGITYADVDPDNDGKILSVTVKVPFTAIQFRKAVSKNLNRLGLASKTPRKSGNTLTFVKK